MKVAKRNVSERASRESKEIIVKFPPYRVPESVEEALKLGWVWRCESFVGLREFGKTKKGLAKREGLAYFVVARPPIEGDSGPHSLREKIEQIDAVVIPFVATYEFGTPRRPKNPYKGGSVLSVDKDSSTEE